MAALTISFVTHYDTDVNEFDVLLRSLFIRDSIEEIEYTALCNNELQWLDQINDKVEIIVAIDNYDKTPTHIRYINNDFNIQRIVDLVNEYKTKLGQKYRNVSIDYFISESNYGPAVNQNTIIEKSKGKYIRFLNDRGISCNINIQLEAINTYQTNVINFPYMTYDFQQNEYVKVYSETSINNQLYERKFLLDNKLTFTPLAISSYKAFNGVLLSKCNPTYAICDVISCIELNVTRMNKLVRPTCGDVPGWESDVIHRIMLTYDIKKLDQLTYQMLKNIVSMSTTSPNSILNYFGKRNTENVSNFDYRSITEVNMKILTSTMSPELLYDALRESKHYFDVEDLHKFFMIMDAYLADVYLDGLFMKKLLVIKTMLDTCVKSIKDWPQERLKSLNQHCLSNFIYNYCLITTNSNNNSSFIKQTALTIPNKLTFNEFIEYLISNGELIYLRNYYSISNLTGLKAINYAKNAFYVNNDLCNKLINYTLKDWLKTSYVLRPDNVNMWLAVNLTKQM